MGSVRRNLVINGDGINGIWQRIFYFPQCILSSMRGQTKGLIIRKVSLKIEALENTGTPDRRLSNMFWETLNWKVLAEHLGNKVNILDIGCGDGKYGTRYKKLLNKKLKSYSGLDVYKNKDFPNEFTHILDKAKNCFLHLKGINLVVSQSALQHIEQDRKVLEVITSNLSKSHPFIQIHLVPAFASLWLRLWHGWRIYSQKNLGSIAASLSSTNKVNIEVVPLGGLRCFITHFTRITIPEFLGKLTNRSSKVDWENESSKTSIKIKQSVTREITASTLFPSFWAILISHEEIDIDSFFK